MHLVLEEMVVQVLQQQLLPHQEVHQLISLVVVAVEVLVPEDHQQRVIINLAFQEDQVVVNQVIKILPLQELVLQ